MSPDRCSSKCKLPQFSSWRQPLSPTLAPPSAGLGPLLVAMAATVLLNCCPLVVVAEISAAEAEISVAAEEISASEEETLVVEISEAV